MHFLVYIGNDETRANLLEEACRRYWGECLSRSGSGYRLLHQPGRLIDYYSSNESWSIISGWCRRSEGGVTAVDEMSGLRQLTKEITGGMWPVHDGITGDYSGVIFSPNQVSIFTCAHGVYPLYWYRHSDELVVSTAMLPPAFVYGLEVDRVGCAESITPPLFVTYGSRSLFKNLQRVQPGEMLTVNSGKMVASYDNTLFAGQHIQNPVDAAEQLLAILTEDTRLLLGDDERVTTALSGGWDSRLVLAALARQDDRVNTCYTYGDSPRAYEVRLAERCANAVRANFTYCDVSDRYFPDLAYLEHSVASTEAAYVSSWYSIIDDIASEDRGLFMLFGDLFESVPGRKVVNLMTRAARKQWFTSRLHGATIPGTPCSASVLAEWEEAMIQSTARTIEGTMKQAVVDPDWDDAAIMHGVMDDVAMNMRRVRSHDLEYLENAIELYHWYAGVRVNAVRQMHVLSPHVAAVSPAQSIRMIRAVSKVDFRMRVTGALQERIIRLMKDTGLSSIPSPDAPWMPSHWPMSLRLINQGVRSTVDQYLIRRMMSHRQSWRRQRVVPTMDFVKLSADPRALERVKSWFAGSSLNTDYYIRKVQRRADMSAWPIGNIDIVAPANVAILSRYCR